jgi:hypothetical protein
VGCHISSLVLGLEGGAGFRSKGTEERWSRGCLDAGAVVDKQRMLETKLPVQYIMEIAR